MTNPLLLGHRLPDFPAIKPEHVEPAVRDLLKKGKETLNRLEGEKDIRWETIVEPQEELALAYQQIWGPVGHLMGVRNTQELREAYEKVLPDVVSFGLTMAQSKPLFAAHRTLLERGDLTPTRKRILEKKLLDARHSGIELEGPERERFQAIAQELSLLGNEFSNNVLDATRAWFLDLEESDQVAGLPESWKELAAESYNRANPEKKATAENGPWRLTLDTPAYLPFMQHARRRDLREAAYLASIRRASAAPYDNTERIRRILELRQEEARLLGYKNFAALSLAEKMAGSVERAWELLESLRVKSLPAARADLSEIQELARANGHELALHDVAFYAERLKEQKFQFNEEDLRPYFPLEKVLAGLFRLVETLFQVRVVAAPGEAPVWHEDVRYFKILDLDGQERAAFYLDPYSRPADKRGGAWMNDCVGRRRTRVGLDKPVAYLICNSTPPGSDRPSLMTFDEVVTLFHEFGHGLQHMLTEIDESDASGINGIEWDAVELPSQFMENWCYVRAVLNDLSGHYRTGEALPDDLYGKLMAARTFRAGSDMLRQLRFAMLDLELHRRALAADETPFDVQRRIDEKTTVMPAHSEDRFLCSFGHIFAGGYSAGYYSYKWAEVMSADAFGAFEDAGLRFSDVALPEAVLQVGMLFRRTVLARGGSSHPSRVYQEFRGRDPDVGALLRHSGLAPGPVPLQ